MVTLQKKNMIKSLSKSNLDFLIQLSKNNNREWFTEHKQTYTNEHESIILFANDLLNLMNKHDVIETVSGKASLHRIYKDIRFSKDKTPYKTNWSGSFKRATKARRGGYYFHISPGNSFVAGGFFSPNTDDLKRIREDIDHNYEEWGKILSNPIIKETFGELIGEQLSSNPKGYDKNHPAISLLRYKQFILKHHFTDEEVLSPDFCVKMNETFQKLRLFFDHMSEVLTTDANGISLID